MSYPPFGTSPIKCARRGCDWKGLETELESVPYPSNTPGGLNAYHSQCPKCGSRAYRFVEPKKEKKR